jgi:PAS domain S-box-containing protein
MAVLAGIGVALIGGTSLAGWLLQIEPLKSLVPGSQPLKPNIAAGMFLCGTALAFLSREKPSNSIRICGGAIAATVIALGALTLGEYFLNWDLGIEQWLARDFPAVMGTAHPGRMMPTTAFCFVLMGAALFAATQLIPSRFGFPLMAGLSAFFVIVGILSLSGFFLETGFGPQCNLLGMTVSGVTAAVGFMLLGSGSLALLQSKGALTWSLDGLTTAGFVFGFVLMVVAPAAAFNFTRQMLETTTSLTHRHEVMKKEQEVMTDMLKLAGPESVYLVAGDEHLLKEREQTKIKVRDDFLDVRKLTSGNPKQQERLDQLERLVAQRLDWGDQVIATRREKGPLAAAQMVATGPGITLSDDLNVLLTRMEDGEQRLLGLDRKRAETATTTVFLVLPLGVFLSLTILSLGMFFLNLGTGERKQAVHSLRQSEEGMRAILDSALDCIITMDHHGRVVEFNPAAVTTFGYRREEAIGQLLSELIIPPSLRERHQKGLARYLATGEAPVLGQRLELSAVRRDGSEFRVELAIIRIGTQTPPMFTGFIRDITEREATTKKLNAQEKQYRLLFDDNPTPMWVYDVQSLNILAVNQAAISSYGYSREEFLSRTLRDMRPAEDVASLEESISDAAAPAGYGGEWRHLKKDGSVITAAVYSSPTMFDNKEARMALALDLTERNEAERKLREAEEKYRSIFDNVSEGIFQNALGGARISANPALARILGYDSPEQLIGEGIDVQRQSYVDPAEREEFKRIMAEHGSVKGLEYQVQRKDGSHIWISESARLVRDADAQPLYYEGSVQDITEQKRAEETLRESEEHLRLVIAASNDGIWEHNYLTGVLTWSDRMYEMFGLDRHSFVPTIDSFADLLHPDDRTPFEKAIRELMANSGRYEAPSRIRLQDGSYGHFLGRGRVVLDGAGKPIRIVGSMADLTTLLQAEKRLVEQTDLLNLAHDAIMVRDMDDRIEFWNHGAEVLYGWTAEEARGRLSAEFFHHQDPIDLLAARQTLLETGVWSGEIRYLTKQGDAVVVRSRWTLVRDEHGNPKSKLIIDTDITEQKKIEEQFLRAQRLESIGTLASGVAHDLNNILLPIMMAAPVLRAETNPAEREKFLDIVESSAQRGANVIKQMLTFARGADGDRVLLQPIYFLEEVFKIAGQTFPKSILRRTSYDENIRSIEADPTQLHQVLLNLCINARDAMPNGGELCLAAENFDVDEHYASITPGATVGPHVMLQVTDTGSGIPSDVIDKIFDPFFTTKGVGQGTGLGLSTVIGIIESHGGFVNVSSRPGRTSFKIFLPAKNSVGTSGAIQADVTVPRGNGETILLVDDEPIIVEVAQLVLENSGYKVLVASDGPTALALFAKQMDHIAAVITDLAMPLMDGLLLVRTLRQMEPRLKVIVSTGHSDDCQAVAMDRLHVDGYLTKPYTTPNLLLKLSHVLHSGARAAA